MSVYPTNFHAIPLDRLQLPNRIHGIVLRTTDLGVHTKSNLNSLKPLFMLLFSSFLKLLRRRSHVQTRGIGKANRAGQANEITSHVYKSWLGSHIIVVTAFLRTFNIAKTCPKRHKTYPEFLSCSI
jgi:hypothetical protein